MGNYERALAEAYKRDILPLDMRPAVEEGIKRGLIPNPWMPTAGVGESFLIGAGRGLTDVGEGLKQTTIAADVALGYQPQQALDDYTRKTDEERALYDSTPVGQSGMGAAGRLTGNVAPFMAVPGVSATASLPLRMAGGALTGGVMGGTAYVPEGESRLSSAGSGVAFGAAMPLVTALAAKGVHSLTGTTGSNQVDDVLALSKKHDVPVSLGDVTQNPALQKAEVLNESVPVTGMSGFRSQQHDAAKRAVERTMARYKQQLGADDWEKIAQTGLKDKAQAVKTEAGKLYDKVERLAAKKGEFQLTRAKATADAILKSLDEKASRGFESADDAAIRKLVTPYSQPQSVGFTLARELRSDLGDAVRDYYQGTNAVVGAKGVGHLKVLKSALEKDMEVFAKSNGRALKKAWNQADDYYRSTVVPFKDRAVAKAISTDEPDIIYREMIKRGRGDRAQKFYNALDDKGRAAVRFGMLDEAYNAAALDRGSQIAGVNGGMSPARFAKALTDIEDARGVFFTGAEKQEIDGLIKLMRHVKRAGQYVENPPTGNRAAQLLLSGGLAYVSPGAAVAGFGTSAVLKQVSTNPVIKRILLASSKFEPGTPGMEKMVTALEQALIKAGGAYGANADL